VPKTILITGAGSGFGKAAAIGMARNGHNVIATVQVSPQVTPLREEAKALGLDAWFLTMRDDKIVKAFAFFDSTAFNEFWTRVTPAAP
jgi:NAD(P)-dependent dehydrogenase (short-subunit alcohol dehydrogenase family)